MDLLFYEKQLYEKEIYIIAGVDEVGRGPIVGPVVASAVILPKNYSLPGLTDSKKLSAKKREYFYDILCKEALGIGIGIVSAKEIDQINILEASKKAMIIAINNLNVIPKYILIDAVKLKIDIPSLSIIKGDAKSLSIAAASVIAKVTRDRMMDELDKKYPQYDFKSNKGYPTKKHLEAINEYGVLSNYRFTFKPISDLMNKGGIIHEIQD